MAQRPVSVLVVEDDADLRAALEMALSQQGHDVQVAGTAEAAKLVLETGRRVEVLLSDHRLPGASGAQLLVAVRERWPHIRRVLVTGHAEPEVLRAVERGVAQHMLFKPFELDVLHLMLARIGEDLLADAERTRLSTEATRLEAALRDQTVRMQRAAVAWRTTIDHVELPIAVVRSDYVVERANRRYAEKSRLPILELAGRRCHELLFGSNAPCDGCPLPAALEANESRVHTLSRPDGRLLRVTAHPFPPDVGGQPAAVCQYDDETERHRVASAAAARERLALVGQLAGGVAHELNSPLAAILTSAQLLRTTAPPEDLESVEVIVQSTNRARRIIESLLRIAGQEHPGPVGKVDVAVAVETALAMSEPLLLGASLERALATALPPVLGTAADVTEAAVLLLASGATGAGPTGKVRIETHEEAGHVVLTVEDDGCARKSSGETPVATGGRDDALFVSRPTGSMLGVSLTRSIAERLGGRLELAPSRFPRGLAHRLFLPAARS